MFIISKTIFYISLVKQYFIMYFICSLYYHARAKVSCIQSIYLLKYIVAKQNLYHMKEFSVRKNVHICAYHVCFKRARFQVSYRFIRVITCNLRGSPYRRNLARGINSLVTAKTNSPTVIIIKEQSAALTRAIIYCSHSII